MPKEVAPFWRFENSATSNGSEATLYIYGDIMQYDMEWWNWPDDVIPHRFRQELDALGDVGTIHVRINSNGGSVFGAYAIMNLLKSHKATVITYNDGIAASAGTLIAMAGDKIVSSLGSLWMIHLPLIGASGDAKELQKAIEILNTVTESMLDVYHGRTGIAKDELLKMLEAETWMTGKQAKDKGFVDEVTEAEVVAYLTEDKAAAFFNGLTVSLDKIPNKRALVAMLPVKSTPPPQPENKNKQEERAMNLEELKSKHPEAYSAAVEEGKTQGSTTQAALDAAREEGVQAERQRIQEIDNISLPGMEALSNKAKFETGITAAAFAVEVLTAQKAQGVNFLNAVKVDAAELDQVPTSGAAQSGDEEDEALLAHLADTAKNLG